MLLQIPFTVLAFLIASQIDVDQITVNETTKSMKYRRCSNRKESRQDDFKYILYVSTNMILKNYRKLKQNYKMLDAEIRLQPYWEISRINHSYSLLLNEKTMSHCHEVITT